jgi:hypothetical protein
MEPLRTQNEKLTQAAKQKEQAQKERSRTENDFRRIPPAVMLALNPH